MQNSLPCVGLVVLVGSLSVVMAPDELPPLPRERPLHGKTALPPIIIDPGHGGRDAGAKGHGLVEKDLTLDLANRINQQLVSFGFPTQLTRTDDRYVSLAQRAALGNQQADAIFLSLHFNHTSFPSASGVETFYEKAKVPPENAWTWVGFFNKPDASQCQSGETLAGYVHTALISQTEASNRGIKSSDLYVVRHVRGPAILIEGGFLSNALEARLLANAAYRDRLATAVVQGVMTYVKNRPSLPPPAKVGPLVKLEP